MNEPREAESDAGENTAPEAEFIPAEDAEAADSQANEGDDTQEVVRLQQEIASLKEDVLRERAEAENVRKRAARDVESAHKYGLERLVEQLLPVKDSLDLGLDAAQSSADLDSLVEGMALTAKMFSDCFEKLNVSAVDPVGERFDADFHQAMTTEESHEVDPGTVLRVMQKGYVLNERLVRPALVVVAKAPA